MPYLPHLDPNSRENLMKDRLWEKTQEEVEELAPCYCGELQRRLGHELAADERCLVCRFVDHVAEYRLTEYPEEA
jgi:hypothetical protein